MRATLALPTQVNEHVRDIGFADRGETPHIFALVVDLVGLVDLILQGLPRSTSGV